MDLRNEKGILKGRVQITAINMGHGGHSVTCLQKNLTWKILIVKISKQDIRASFKSSDTAGQSSKSTLPLNLQL